jgi:hypothetical protein
MTDDVDLEIETAFTRWADERQYTLSYRAPMRRPFAAGFRAAFDYVRQTVAELPRFTEPDLLDLDDDAVEM